MDAVERMGATKEVDAAEGRIFNGENGGFGKNSSIGTDHALW